MRDHKDLDAFKLADEVVLMIYRITAGFPVNEMYGLTSQMRRAAVSVASNIVEGCSRISQKEFIHFLEISSGSLKELRYQFDLSFRLGYCNKDAFIECDSKIERTGKIISCLIVKVRSDLGV